MDKVVIRPISAIIPTAARSSVLQATLISLSQQNVQPAVIIIIDASDNDETERLSKGHIESLQSQVLYLKATKKGAATQREQGIAISRYEYILFCDDDLLFEPNCIERLWSGINTGTNIGGVNAMVTNQRYFKPGKLTATMYRIMNGEKLATYAGKCIGPAWNLLPEDDDSLPELVEVEWLNTTCTLYRKEALPNPVFQSHFTGYSLMEDLTLSLIVNRKYKLYNARTARIYHDSQPGTHKSNVFGRARMELVNRHYVMRYVLGRSSFNYYLKLILLELFGIVTSLSSLSGWKKLLPTIAGKIAAIIDIIKTKAPGVIA